MNDTIVALATPPGKSGLGVIRLSGQLSTAILQKFSSRSDFIPEPRRALLLKLRDPESGDLIDEVVAVFFKGPYSFTGEDVVEISAHGSPVILRRIIDICLKLNARIAQPGEFTLRALMNGRLNLSQAEAIRDLIDSQSVAAAKQSVRQLSGELSNQLQPLKDKLLNVIVILESTLEFVEDDVPEYQLDSVKNSISELSSEFSRLAQTFSSGRLIRDGLKVAFVGRPNVGKSSLFNALVGHERAIVTDIAGTTRDSLHEKLVIKDIPISLIDTAGLRDTTDTVESIGVERTKQTVADADLVVAVFDGSADSVQDEDLEILAQTNETVRVVVVNKLDISSGSKPDFSAHTGGDPVVMVSAKTGEGLAELEEAIVRPFMTSEIDSNGFMITDARHHDLLLRARSDLDNSLELLNQRMSEEIVLIGLHNAIRYLGEITGETTTEDMLTRIFSTFCIGK